MEHHAFYPAKRQFTSANTLGVQALYSMSKHIRFYGEAGISAASESLDLESSTPTTSRPFSLLAGAVFDTQKITVRANYASQGSTYLPLVGQFNGDRRGPFAEIRYRPIKSVEMFAAASKYRNNLEERSDITTFHSTSQSAGVSVALPWKLNLSGQLSEISYTASNGDPADESYYRQDSKNRQVSLSLAR